VTGVLVTMHYASAFSINMKSSIILMFLENFSAALHKREVVIGVEEENYMFQMM
jgi:hypothetical protein